LTRNNPYFIAALLLLLHFASGYPGGMSPDTFDQFGQSLALNFNSHHPPVMAMLWSFFHKIYAGPQTMLLLHLSLLWGGALIMYLSNPQNKYKWLYFALPFVPNILSQSTMIWKDIGFAICFFFVSTACIFYTYRQKKAPIYVVFFLLLVTFYGTAIKFQAQFIVPLLVYWVVKIAFNLRFLGKVIISGFFSFVIIFANSYIIDNYSVQTNSWQQRQIFDLAAISLIVEDENVIPEYLKQDPIYDYEKMKKYYTSKTMDSIFWNKGKVVNMTSDPKNLLSLDTKYKESVWKYPHAYLLHRLLVLGHTFAASKHYLYAFLPDDMVKNYDFHYFKKNRIRSLFAKYIRLVPRIFTASAISLILVIMYFLAMRKSQSIEAEILGHILIVILGYCIVLSYTLLASEYRYMYIIRLLSFFALPIYLHLREKVPDSNV